MTLLVTYAGDVAVSGGKDRSKYVCESLIKQLDRHAADNQSPSPPCSAGISRWTVAGVTWRFASDAQSSSLMHFVTFSFLRT
jgi:hypothetical protein